MLLPFDHRFGGEEPAENRKLGTAETFAAACGGADRTMIFDKQKCAV
jgi:hypothetical protein